MAALPTTMTAIGIKAAGGPDMLVSEQRPAPVPGAGEILVKVAAAGVNRPDVMQRMGLYPPPPGAPDIPGLEIAGEVAALGTDVKRWKLGDRVMALVVGGGYAEYCIAHESHALPMSGLSMIEAAAVPETFFTVWHNAFERGGLKKGETLLIHGGSSGIGTTAIQLAHAREVNVVATAGSDLKCRAAERIGALRGINYRLEDFAGVVKDITGGRGVDVILDIMGGSYTARNLSCLARDGRLVQIGVMGGSTADVPLRIIMLKRLTLTGSTLRIRTPAEKGTIAAALEREVWPLLESGQVRPIIDGTFSLGAVVEAHRRLEAGDVIGKLVLQVK